MESNSHRASNIKKAVLSVHLEMVEIANLLSNGDPTSKRQAVIRMTNLRRLADSIYSVDELWKTEMEKEGKDRKEFIASVLGDLKDLNEIDEIEE